MAVQSTNERQGALSEDGFDNRPRQCCPERDRSGHGEHVGDGPITAEERIPEIVARARAAQDAWGSLPFAERAEALTVLPNVVVERSEEIAETVSRGMGKPLVDALVGDVGLVLDEFDEYIQNGAEFLARQGDRPRRARDLTPKPPHSHQPEEITQWATTLDT